MSNLPNKRYYAVGEVCRYCNLKAYTLRYWEKKTGFITPVRINNRRYYTQRHIKQILKLKSFIHDQSYSIDQAAVALEQDFGHNGDYQSILSQIDAILSE